MKLIKNLIFIKVFAVLIITNANAQIGSSPEEEFLVGSFIHSSMVMQHTQYNNYEQVLDMGINAAMQIAVKDVPRLGQVNNFQQLSLFPYIYVANDSGTGSNPEICPWCNAEPENIDWISYFTHAKYMKWEAEGDALFPDPNSNVRIKNEFGYNVTDGDITARASGLDANNIGKYLIHGPDYWQYPRYTYTNPGFNTTPIRYKAVFKMKIDTPSEQSLPVCEISVTMYNDSRGIPETVLDSKILTTDDLTTEYQEFGLIYDYIPFIYPNNGDHTKKMIPATITNPFEDIESNPSMNAGSKVQFKVKWLGNRELFVDYIEVYDFDIWEAYFIDNPIQLISNIVNYDQGFRNNSDFYSKLKYYGTLDEPHVIDCYIPLRKVQEILDSVGINKKLLTHWYPGWDHNRDGDNTWPVYVQLAQPKKIMFWYSPYVAEENGSPTPRDFTQYWFHRNLQQAHLQQPDYYVTLQAWGWWGKNVNRYVRWMTPTPEEISAQTMLALAHGTKGLFYEHYYTLDSIYFDGFDLLVEALVDLPENNFEPFPNWYKVQNLSSRLRGTLGNILKKLEYPATNINNGYIRLCRNSSNPDIETPEVVSGNYLTMSSIPQNPSPGLVHFFAGFLEPTYQPENHYFLLTNLNTTSAKQVTISLTDNNYGYPNMRFRNVEPEFNFDATFTNNYSEQITIAAGEGYLYQVAPVVKFGGNLIADEIVGEGMTLYDDMTIGESATLTINGTYFAKANITVKSGGKIAALANGKIIFDAGKGIIVDGNAQIYGTANNRLELDFNSGGPGVTVNFGGSLSMSYCNINNAVIGINAEAAGTVNISNVNFTNCQYYGIVLFGFGNGDITPPPPTIYKCNITGSSSGISVVNCNEVVIRENTISSSNLGIYVNQVSSAHIQGNIIQGNSSSALDGIFMENCGGYIRSNIITNHANGIHLGNSSPDIGGNILQHNKFHGLYVGDGSIPNLIAFLQINPPLYFPLSGFNQIKENGMGSVPNDPAHNDGSEIYLSYSDILLGSEKFPGCNQVIDDRTSTPNMNTLLLINGELKDEEANIFAQYNYWGITEPTQSRFGQLPVIFEPYYFEPCIEPQGSQEQLIVRTSEGEPIDIIYAFGGINVSLTELEESYAAANKHFVTGEILQAKVVYEQIVQSQYTALEKAPAYSKLITIGNLTGSDESYFTDLQYVFNNIINSVTDSLVKKIYLQKSILCDISKKEYLTAIEGFDNIIQQNPNSQEAIYAELDIITTALRIDTNNTQLGKISGGKYLIKDRIDYLSKLNGLLTEKFSINTSNEQKVIPEEYHLYQNYPNPFNPATIIKFDLPKEGVVELGVYDILGRKITTLINEHRNAGSYEQNFNASSFASGIYLYRIKVNDFVSAKKMILVK